MCGISGAFSKELSSQQETMMTHVMRSQKTRGPDHEACIKLNGARSQTWLGHNRLSIIDLTQEANQPMWDDTHRYCIVYNGEIYNYIELRQTLQQFGFQFNTSGDTEVILNAFSHWGVHALNYFRGPFAFALYDTKEEKLWLCRDRFGIRPLYYVVRDDALYFASTTKALAESFHLAPNLDYVTRGLTYLVYEDDTHITPYQNMFCVPSGCYLVAEMCDHGRFIHYIERYYYLEEKVTHLIHTLPDTVPDLLELIQHRFEEAVTIRLRADVPLAISLSGGLDSSTVAASVSKKHDDIMAFSYAHPHHQQSEGPVIQHCAQFLNLNIKYVWPNTKEMIAALFQTIDAQDAPFPSLSIVAQFLLYQHVRASGIKVLLGGQGGDEVFMGYRKFLLFKLRALLKSREYVSALYFVMQLLPGFLAEMGNFKTYWAHRHRYFQHKQLDTVLNLPHADSMQRHQGENRQRQIQDIMQFSLPSLLRYEDRNAMGNSVESRLPFMDHELVELGLALPEAIKLRAGYGKWIIRHMMKNKIPDAIRLARYKRGFDIPLTPLLQQGLGTSIRERLKEKSVTRDFVKRHHDIDVVFSDQAFQQTPRRLSEAITLLWLSKAHS